jgi:hypothetical protein
MRVFGDGHSSIILKKGGADPISFRFFGDSNKTMEGIEIDHLNFKAVDFAGSINHSVLAFSAGSADIDGISIHDNEFDYGSSDNICVIFAVLPPYTIHDLEIKNNLFYSKYCCIAFNNHESNDYLIGNIDISGNVIEKGGLFAITISGCIEGITVSSNYIKDADRGIELVNVRECSIEDNVFAGTFGEFGIIQTSSWSSRPAASDIFISGNTTLGRIRGGFLFQGTRELSIEKNQFDTTGLMNFNNSTAFAINNWLTRSPNSYLGSRLSSVNNHIGEMPAISSPFRKFIHLTNGLNKTSLRFIFAKDGSWNEAAMRIRATLVHGARSEGDAAEKLITFRRIGGEAPQFLQQTDNITTGNASISIELEKEALLITATCIDSDVYLLWNVELDPVFASVN